MFHFSVPKTYYVVYRYKYIGPGAPRPHPSAARLKKNEGMKASSIAVSQYIIVTEDKVSGIGRGTT
jgi:hypothetical protein